MSVTPYEKLYKDDVICIGDIVSIDPIQNKVRLAFNTFKERDKYVIRYMYKNRG